jgi:hypothetical protein
MLWHWSGVVPPGGTLELRLVRGSVRAETSSRSTVEILTSLRGTRSNPASVRLVVDTTVAGIHVQDRYPAMSASAIRAGCLPPSDGRGDYWHSDVRLETVVRVPVGVRLVVRLMDGDIDVRALEGPREVRTNQGAVHGVGRYP